MIEFLALQVRLGKITIDRLPEKYRNDVQAVFDSEKNVLVDQASNEMTIS